MSENQRKGDVAEMAFDLEATKRGYNVSKPARISLCYDRILECNGRMFRVQIKSAHGNGKYISVMLRKSNKSLYSPDEIDIFAIYIIGANEWHFELPNNASTSVSLGVKKAINNNWKIFEHELH